MDMLEGIAPPQYKPPYVFAAQGVPRHWLIPMREGVLRPQQKKLMRMQK